MTTTRELDPLDLGKGFRVRMKQVRKKGGKGKELEKESQKFESSIF